MHNHEVIKECGPQRVFTVVKFKHLSCHIDDAHRINKIRYINICLPPGHTATMLLCQNMINIIEFQDHNYNVEFFDANNTRMNGMQICALGIFFLKLFTSALCAS